jgi:DNA repair protein RadC
MSGNTATHSHGGHRQRQRERFRTTGLEGFAPHEVLELILGYAIPRQDVNPLAHRLLEHFGSLHNVMDASVEELMHVEGIGEYTAVLLTLFAQVERKTAASRIGPKCMLRTREDADTYCINLLKGRKVEHFYAIYLNGQMEVIAQVLIAKGSISDVPSYPRVVADHALRNNAHAVIICHNHPGGSLTPSTADMGSTMRLRSVLEDLEVRLIDHLVVAGDQAASVMENGLFPQPNNSIIAENRAANSAGEVTVRHQLLKLKKKK